MTQTITSYMQADHVLIDGFAERALRAADVSDWSTFQTEGAVFLQRLRRHIEMEEKVLFPVFEKGTGMVAAGPSRQMRIEHELMQPILAEMEQAIAGNDGAGFRRTKTALFDILKPHNVKEERMMYPMIEDAAGDGAQALLLEVKAMAV